MLRTLTRTGAALALLALVAGVGAAVVAGDREAHTRPQGTGPGVRRPTVPERAPARDAKPRSPAPGPLQRRRQAIRWRRSTPVGLHWAGRLVDGVQLPSEGRLFFTWDPIQRRSPNRGWRRWGSNRLVRVLLQVAAAHAAANPDAPRMSIGDLSRPHGGDFGPRYGLPGHVSHQNGLDADVYYPRRDGRELPPGRPAQIDRRLAQDLVDRFVAAGAIRVFVGPRTGLRGPPGIVQVLPNHDNHLHVRLAK